VRRTDRVSKKELNRKIGSNNKKKKNTTRKGMEPYKRKRKDFLKDI